MSKFLKEFVKAELKNQIQKEISFYSERVKDTIAKNPEKYSEEQKAITKENLWSTISKYANGQYYITFSDIAKVGVNPLSNFNTPLGVYCYPLTKEIFDDYKSGQLPFASDRKYVCIFAPKNMSKIIIRQPGKLTNRNIVIPAAKKISGIEDDNQLINKIILNYENLNEKLITNDELGELSLFYVWYQCNNIAGKRSKNQIIPNQDTINRLYKEKSITKDDYITTIHSKNYSKELMTYGIEGVVDLCPESDNALIHENEPTQAVFFRTSSIREVAIINNPLIKLLKQKKENKTEDIQKELNDSDLENIDNVLEVAKFTINPKNFYKIYNNFILAPQKLLSPGLETQLITNLVFNPVIPPELLKSILEIMPTFKNKIFNVISGRLYPAKTILTLMQMYPEAIYSISYAPKFLDAVGLLYKKDKVLSPEIIYFCIIIHGPTNALKEEINPELYHYILNNISSLPQEQFEYIVEKTLSSHPLFNILKESKDLRFIKKLFEHIILSKATTLSKFPFIISILKNNMIPNKLLASMKIAKVTGKSFRKPFYDELISVLSQEEIKEFNEYLEGLAMDNDLDWFMSL